ncbi:MAG: permease [Alphaproteobacteria bacterium]|nr:permease [Alphaproteobacteria bacterium]
MTALALQLRTAARNWRALDPVWLALAAGLAALLVLVPAQGAKSVGFVADHLLRAAPVLLVAIAVAAYAKASNADHLIVRAFQGREALMVVFAALVGALSPFCSCGVIPLIAALLAIGVPLSAVMAFWLASPLMDPTMFAVTSGVLGIGFATAKTVAAIAVGLLGGYGVMALQAAGAFREPLREGIGNGGCAGSRIRQPKPVRWGIWREAARRQAFAKEARGTLLFLGKWLTVAFLLESLMATYVPASAIATVLGSDSWAAIPLAAFIGLPAYLNGYAALPLVNGLMGSGMGAGAAMAFLVAGGVSSIPAMIAVYALARLPVFLAYLGFALVGSILSGYAYQLYVG